MANQGQELAAIGTQALIIRLDEIIAARHDPFIQSRLRFEEQV